MGRAVAAGRAPLVGLGLVWTVSLLACEEPVEFSPVTEELSLDAPDRVVVGSVIGAESVEIPLRIVNTYGATVPGQLFEVEVTGEALAAYEAQVRPDALGFGTVTVTSEVAQALGVVVVASSGTAKVGDEGTSWLTGGQAYPLPLQRAFELDVWPEHLARGSGGVVWSSENQVWFQRTDGQGPPDEILTLPDLIEGMTAIDLDGDGYQDLVVWTATRVVMLRGRGLDGFTWSTGFTVPGARLRGVDVADFDGDRLPDLAIGFAEVDGIFQGAQVLLQVGFDAWDALPPLRRELEITDVALGDFVGEGLSEVVLLTESGPYRYGFVERWTEPDRAWNRVDPNLSWLLDGGGQLLPSRDLDGEGTLELIGVGTASELDSDKHLSFYTIGETATRFDLAFPDFAADLVDLTGDGVDDLVLLVPDGEAAQLRTVTYEEGEAIFKNRGLAGLPFLGELAVGDLDSDGDRDVVVAGDNLWLYQGGFGEEGWGLEDESITSFGLSLAGPVHLYDWDQDGRTDVLAVREVSEGIVLQHFEVGIDPDTGSTVLQAYDNGQVLIDDHDPTVKAQGLDIAVCEDQHVFVLLSDGETVGWRIRRDGAGGIDVRDSGPVDGTAIACGTLASGASAAVVNAAGDVNEVNGSFGVVATYSAGSSAGDLAVADVDGAGPAVHVCETPGCSLAVVDLDGDGQDELLEGGDNPVLRFATGEVSLEGEGTAGVADLNGDGLPDLLLTSQERGTVTLFQYAGSDRLPARWLHTRREMLSPLHLGDADADGFPELWWVSSDGTLVHTTRSGVVSADTETSDTGAGAADSGG